MSLKPGVRYASFWRRLLAVVLDFFLMNIVVGIVTQLFFGNSAAEWVQTSLEHVQNNQAPPMPPSPLLIPMSLLLPALYASLFWCKMKALPAQMLLDIQVVRAKTGGALGFGASLLRYCTLVLSLYAILLADLLVPPAGMLLIVVYIVALRRHPKMQALHDLLVGSVVIMEDDTDKPMDEFTRGF